MENNQTEKVKRSVKNEFIPFYFSDLIKGLRKYWWLATILTVVFAAVSFVSSYRRYEPVYSTSATFTISTSTGSTRTDGGMTAYSYYYDSATAAQLSTTFPYILNSNILQDSICEELGYSYLPASLGASSVAGSNMFTITCSGGDPQVVYDVLVCAIDKYPEAARYVVGNIKFTMITNPYVPTAPNNKNVFIHDAFNGALIGLFLGLSWILIYCVSRKTIRTKDEISEQLGMDVVGVLPRVTFMRHKQEIDRSILRTNPNIGRGFLESLRLTRNTFVHSLKPKEKVVLITSTAPGEGKSTVAVNIAASLADLGKKVLLVDGDIRNPSVCGILKLDPETMDYFLERQTFCVGHVESCHFDLMNFFLEDQYWSRMRTENVQRNLDQFRDLYDYILIDTPPCGLISDTLVIAQAADAAVYVIMQDAVRMSRIKSGIDHLLSSGIRVIGCVFNGAESGIVGYGENYGYSHYGQYGHYGHYGHYGQYGHYGHYGDYGDQKKKKGWSRFRSKSGSNATEKSS